MGSWVPCCDAVRYNPKQLDERWAAESFISKAANSVMPLAPRWTCCPPFLLSLHYSLLITICWFDFEVALYRCSSVFWILVLSVPLSTVLLRGARGLRASSHGSLAAWLHVHHAKYIKQVEPNLPANLLMNRSPKGVEHGLRMNPCNKGTFRSQTMHVCGLLIVTQTLFFRWLE